MLIYTSQVTNGNVHVDLPINVRLCVILFNFRPAPTVTWKKVGDALPGGRFNDQLEDGTMLRIDDVQWDDESEYVCTGTSSAGSKTHTITVDVQCKQPQSKNPPSRKFYFVS